jgi:hypothetical protein
MKMNFSENNSEYVTDDKSPSSWRVKCGWRVRLTTLPPSVSRLSRENVRALTSHNPMGLYSLLQGWLYLLPFFSEKQSHLSEVTGIYPVTSGVKKIVF